MPYSIAIGALQVFSDSAVQERVCTCSDAVKGCTPSFVFSINGQVAFRHTLDHLLTCEKRECVSLRKKVKHGMHQKLRWLFAEEVLLGCLQVQPFLYREKTVVDVRAQRNFRVVAHHLASCPHESCAKLRRSLLLTIRNFVSPNSKDPVL